jgi:hypothetical protein
VIGRHLLANPTATAFRRLLFLPLWLLQVLRPGR